MLKISVTICCANVEDTLEQACRSVSWADELIVVDSGSKDTTPDIAKRYASKYVLEPWRGYSNQKKFSLELCRNNWVFSLDGDEECSPELAKELQEFPEEQLKHYDLLYAPRHNYVMGRHVRAWDPDRSSRILHRNRCRWPDEVLHDARLPSDPSRVFYLKSPILHKRHSARGFTDYFSGQRQDERLLKVAQEMYDRGKRCHGWDLTLRPWGNFLKFYLIKRGFRDGMFGLLIAQKAAVSTQLKYAALWSIQQNKNNPSPATSR
jgi:glycosyltransferase involved in cell wall biosynthesis